jgi:hypothetical protein
MHACAVYPVHSRQIHGSTAHPAQQQWLSWQAQTHMRAHSLQSMQNQACALLGAAAWCAAAVTARARRPM